MQSKLLVEILLIFLILSLRLPVCNDRRKAKENQVKMADTIAGRLNSIYHPMKGKEFLAIYRIANFSMPQTENVRDVLHMEEQDPLLATIRKTLSDVLELQKRIGKRVWTGITGPEISPRYTDYWMWVEPLCVEAQVAQAPKGAVNI